ncbi:glycosyltransferase family 4 protein [Massilia niastensis]|uniref:glycosyltransferase family 4 protein n=1 Tax=Massilia niastensis TaxID=544911 RepID=UPI000368BB6A|nr:glycosyltransferase family 4 protein [Massilia niastensis]
MLESIHRPAGRIAPLPLVRRQRARPTLLLASDSRAPCGVGRHMLTLARALRHELEPLLVFADTRHGHEWAQAARLAGLRACVAPAHQLASGGPGLAALFEQHRPDICHVHAGAAWEGHPLAASARACGVAAVLRTEHLPCTLRGPRDHALEAAYVHGIAPVDRVICVSRAARRTFLASGAAPERYEVVYNGIEQPPSPAARDGLRAGLGLDGRFAVLTVARFVGRKRHATLLQALPGVLERHPGVELLWVGDGPLMEELRTQAARLGVAGHVRFLGFRHDVGELMAAADAYCLPSELEGHPLTVLEAMAAGLPVVAARAPGTTEALQDEETGLLYRHDSAALLRHALCRLIGDPDLARCLGEAGRQAVGRAFTAQRMARETVAIYLKALRAHPRHAWTDRP